MATTKRSLRVLTAAFAVGSVILVAVLALIEIPAADSPDLADGAALAIAAVGSLGVAIALFWWSRLGERAITPQKIQMGFVVRMAIAELGLLLCILAVFMTKALPPALVGLGLFLVALLVLVLAWPGSTPRCGAHIAE
jgi:hypothetical protein